MDLLSELREAILRGTTRESRYRDAQLARDLPAQATDPLDPFGTAVDEGQDDAFATGYDSGSGATTVPFQFDVSIWGAGDIWTGS